MQLKIQNKHPLIDKLNDLEIGFDPIPLTKKRTKTDKCLY